MFALRGLRRWQRLCRALLFSVHDDFIFLFVFPVFSLAVPTSAWLGASRRDAWRAVPSLPAVLPSPILPPLQAG